MGGTKKQEIPLPLTMQDKVLCAKGVRGLRLPLPCGTKDDWDKTKDATSGDDACLMFAVRRKTITKVSSIETKKKECNRHG